MKEATGQAPGKVILIGEHAVVYGYPAITSTINLKSQYIVKPNISKNAINLTIPRFDFQKEYKWEEILHITNQVNDIFEEFLTTGNVTKPRKHLNQTGILQLITLREILDYFDLDELPSLTLEGTSNVPIGGFGSSTAAGVSLAKAVLNFIDVKYTNSDLFEIMVNVESKLYSISSDTPGKVSGLDQATVVHEGMIKFVREKDGAVNFEKLNISSPLLNDILIINTGRPENTTGEVVGHVKQKLFKLKDVIKDIFGELGIISDDILDTLQYEVNKDRFYTLVKRSGDLLIDLGIVTDFTKKIIKDIEKRGGYTKISGAGAITGKGSGSLLCFAEDYTPIQAYLSANDIPYLKTSLG